MTHAGSAVESVWFDGLNPRPQRVALSCEGSELVLTVLDAPSPTTKRYPFRKIRWAERRSHGLRQTDLPDDTMLQHAEPSEWDAWVQANGVGESPVVGWMQSWRGVAVAVCATVAVLGVSWVWGVPWASSTVAQWVPESVEQHIGEAGLKQLDALFLEPSKLPLAEQEAIRQRFASLVEQAYASGQQPKWSLAFHKSEILGANAFALPGGYIVITDDLVNLLKDVPDATIGVLAHELGHVERRHGLDLLVRASLVSAMVGVVIGDASGFLTTVPVTLVTQAYSRDAERESDAQAARMLHASGISPAIMGRFFERLLEDENRKSRRANGSKDEGIALPIAISSHPDHEERIRFFRNWSPETP